MGCASAGRSSRPEPEIGAANARGSEPGVGPDLATFFEVSLDMLCIRDGAFRFAKVNQAWETVLGHPIGELEGRSMLDFIHPDDVPASHDTMRRIETDDEVVGFVNRYRHRDGGYRNLEWRARRVGDRVFGVARDVTERLAFEADLAAAKEAAEAANRAKSDFLANMSHEIRTPLNGVIGVAAALGKTALTAEQREMVELIESSGVTLERLVSDVLDFSKIEAGRLDIEMRPFDLAGELDGLLDVYRLRAQEKGLAFPVELGPTARGDFVGDGVRIKQVLGNLLSNAVKFTTRGEVRVRIDVREPQAEGATATLVVEVQDTGIGFDQAFAASLYQRFSQADGAITRRFGGTGLGLSISRALIEMMGGEVEATSRPGHGSRFRIVLPLARRQSLADYDASRHVTKASPHDDDAGLRLQSLRVLLAEDHPVNRRVIELILGPFGVDLTTVENGAEAVDAFASGTFDVILMDMQMPVMDGLAATRAIRQLESRSPDRPRTPLVMLSANAMRQHRDDAAAAGADVHIAKPVTATALIEGLVVLLTAETDGQALAAASP